MRITRFDVTVWLVAGALIALIVLSVVLVTPPERYATVLYLGPADSAPQNIWRVDPTQEDNEPEQITFSEIGVFDFAPSPDGRYIAYSERIADTNVTELFLLDLTNGRVRQLTQCLATDATCHGAAWRPDSRVLAYERQERNTDFGLGISPSRIWLLDLSVEPASSFPLLEDTQVLGSQPTWSGDGSRLAFYEGLQQLIIVYDFTAISDESRLYVVPFGNGTPGSLSFNGNQLAYSELSLGAGETASRSVMNIADLENGTTTPLSDVDDNYDDGILPEWRPDSNDELVFTRRYLTGTRATRGQQVYLADMTSDQITPLIFDDAYTNGFIHWNPEGNRLVIQRILFGGGLPEIWVYDLETDDLSLVAQNGYIPRWLP